MEVGANYVMGSARGVSDPTGHLFHVERCAIQGEEVILSWLRKRQEAEARRRIIPQLLFALTEINRATAQPAGSARFESLHLKAEVPQRVAKARTGIRHSPPGSRILADMQ